MKWILDPLKSCRTPCQELALWHRTSRLETQSPEDGTLWFLWGTWWPSTDSGLTVKGNSIFQNATGNSCALLVGVSVRRIVGYWVVKWKYSYLLTQIAFLGRRGSSWASGNIDKNVHSNIVSSSSGTTTCSAVEWMNQWLCRYTGHCFSQLKWIP